MLEETPDELMTHLQEYGFLADLNDAEQAALAGALSLVTVERGEWLFRQGDPAHGMYILYKGVMRVVLATQGGQEVVLDVIDSGTAVGEMALLTGRPRSAGVQAISDCALIRIPNDELNALAVEHPAIRETLLALAEERFQNTQLAGVLSRFFGDLDAEALYELREQMTWQHVQGGETVMNQGDYGDTMVIVVNGRLRILAESVDGDKRLIGEVGRGETVGEFALLTQQPRTATVTAVRDSDLLLLSAATFERLSEKYPKVILNIARDIVVRDQQRGQVIDRPDAALSLVVLPVSESAPLAEFTKLLEAGLAAQGRTILLDSARFDSRFGLAGAAQTPSEDASNIAITAWLNQQEAVHDTVVTIADSAWSEWTRRCIRGADRIVLLADATAPPELSLCEEAILELTTIPYLDLVLVQPDTLERPSGTSRWLEGRPISAHHHLRMGSASDFQRLVRRLTGRATGLVLGGGAARGFAHIGVDRALTDAAIPIDVLGGTSMGALMAGAIAMDFGYEDLFRRMSKYGSKDALLDLTYPATAIYESKKVTDMLQDNFGDVAIEDLWRPFFCVSTNMTRSEPLVHERGPLWEALRASLAIPGVFSPISYEGDLLVDGGVMNNLPIDLMREKVGSGYVIAVDVNPRQEKSREWDFGPSVNGWQVMRSRVNPMATAPRVPSLAGTILRAFIINSNYQLERTRHLADLLIQLDTGEYNIMDWSAYQELIEIGYDEAARQLSGWQGDK